MCDGGSESSVRKSSVPYKFGLKHARLLTLLRKDMRLTSLHDIINSTQSENLASVMSGMCFKKGSYRISAHVASRENIPHTVRAATAQAISDELPEESTSS